LNCDWVLGKEKGGDNLSRVFKKHLSKNLVYIHSSLKKYEISNPLSIPSEKKLNLKHLFPAQFFRLKKRKTQTLVVL
jgi:hypothetical protein